ncbi:hypothetical protein ACFS7Z_21000 [Pontibacter toksunensis]|uniref:Bacteriocin biosynthesis cyclodehydratase domain-containing protein n=1 Tax=Pontibacter toksunensis TaxID=1332631 RepID=A0ABW6C0R7_9BACT
MASENPGAFDGSFSIIKDDSSDETDASLVNSAFELINGANTLEQIWGKLLVAGFEPQAIGLVLAELERQGRIDEVDSWSFTKSPALAGQTVLLGQMAAQEGMVANSEVPILVGRKLQSLLSTSKIIIFGTSLELTTEIKKMLKKVGVLQVQLSDFTLCENGFDKTQQKAIDEAVTKLKKEKSRLLICATSGGDNLLAEMVNRASVVSGIPAIYYNVHGFQMQLGPLVIPKQTACYKCHKIRREAALAPWERSLLGSVSGGERLACTLGADWITIDAIKFLSNLGEPVSRGRVLFIDYYGGLPEVHTVLRIPRCEVCGNSKRPAIRLWEDSK